MIYYKDLKRVGTLEQVKQELKKSNIFNPSESVIKENGYKVYQEPITTDTQKTGSLIIQGDFITREVIDLTAEEIQAKQLNEQQKLIKERLEQNKAFGQELIEIAFSEMATPDEALSAQIASMFEPLIVALQSGQILGALGMLRTFPTNAVFTETKKNEFILTMEGYLS